MIILKVKITTFGGQNDCSPAETSEADGQSSECAASKRAVSGIHRGFSSTSLNNQKSSVTTALCKSRGWWSEIFDIISERRLKTARNCKFV